MKRKTRKRLRKTVAKAVAKYGAPTVLAFVSTLLANMVSDSIDRTVSPEPEPGKVKASKATPRRRRKASAE